MMVSYEDTENRIMGNLLRTPLESKSMRQIAISTGLSYVTIHRITPLLLKRRLVKTEKKGKANLVSVDLEHAPTEKLSSAALSEKGRFTAKHPRLAILSREIEETLAGEFYILLLFGSYAKGESRKDSDIDLLFIIPDGKDSEAYREKIDKALRLHPGIKKDFNMVSAGDFMDMLGQKYTVGRSAFQHGIALFGTEHYYAMVKSYAGTKGY